MEIHPSNDLHTCKMKHEDDSENEIFQLYNNFFSYVTNRLDRFQYSRADIMDIHPSTDLHTCQMEHQDEIEYEIVQLV